MKMNIGKKLAVVTVGCACVLAIQQANANSILDTTTFNLSNPNSGISSYPGPYASVQIDLTTLTTADITFTGLTSGNYEYLIGVLGLQVNATSASVSGTGYGSTFNTVHPSQEDGFGKFNLEIAGPNGSSSAVSSISFTLTDNSGTWANASSVLTPNSQGNNAVAHIYVFESDGQGGYTATGATGFAGNGRTTDVPDGGATALLLGAALTGITLIRRKLS